MRQFIRSNKHAVAVLVALTIISGVSSAILILEKPSLIVQNESTAQPSLPRKNEALRGLHPTSSPLKGGFGGPPSTERLPSSVPLKGERKVGVSRQKSLVNQAISAAISEITAAPSTSTLSRTSTAPFANQISATLFIADREYQIIANPGTSLYSVMDNLKQSEQITFSAKEFSGMGYFIEEINGVRNSTRHGTYWIYYVNGEPAKIGVSNYIVKSNNVINWKYENEK